MTPRVVYVSGTREEWLARLRAPDGYEVAEEPKRAAS